MTLLPRVRRALFILLACGAAMPGWAAPPARAASDPVDTSVTYRCPGNDYKNTISAKEAEKLGCRKLEGAPITVIQTVKPRPAAASGSGMGRVDPAAQRARDSDARRILEDELKAEEGRLAALRKEYNNGQPERLGDERNYQKYTDRVAEMSAAIARKEADIAAIRREIQKLPPPATSATTSSQ